MDTKSRSIYICLQEAYFRRKKKHRLKAKGLKKTRHSNGNEKKAGVSIFISEKKDFKARTVQKTKKGIT